MTLVFHHARNLAPECCPSNTRTLPGKAEESRTAVDEGSEHILAGLRGRAKKVTRVVLQPFLLSSTPQMPRSGFGWSQMPLVGKLFAQKSAVPGLSLHAIGESLPSSSNHQCWASWDTQTGYVRTKVAEETTGRSPAVLTPFQRAFTSTLGT